MELVTIRQMKAADSNAINKYGIPEKTLMYNAAAALVKALLLEKGENIRTAVFCGPGNNGGDGWAAASILREKKKAVTVITGTDPETLSGSSGYYAKKAVDSGVDVIRNANPGLLERYDAVIDAIFGIGLSREVKGIYLDFIETINTSRCFTLCADTPSGLFSDEGIPWPVAVRGDMTLCFGRPKASLFSEAGCIYTGKVINDKIGIPDDAYESATVLSTDAAFAGDIYKMRSRTGFKGNYGKIMVIAGSPGMTGAAALCTESCFRSGAGLVYIVVPESVKYEYEGLVKEAIGIPVRDDGRQFVGENSIDGILEAAKGKTAAVIGPGLHPKSNSHMICRNLLEKTELPLIIDARTLVDLKNDIDILKMASGKAVVTPHPGEMSVLTGHTIEYIQNNRMDVAAEFAERYGIVVLLKGHRTVITDGKTIYINTKGNPGMGTAGSGDVLCGIISAALAYTPSLLDAAAAGAYIHGAAGDEASKEFGEYGMKSGDIITKIPDVIKKLTGEQTCTTCRTGPGPR